MAIFPSGAPGEAPQSGATTEDSNSSWQGALGALARRARSATLESLQQQELTAPLNSPASGSSPGDLENGEQPRWASWARQAAESVRVQAQAAAQEGLEQAQKGLERARDMQRTVDWSEQLHTVQGNMSRGLENAKDRAQSAGATLQEKMAAGVERAKSHEWTESAKGQLQNVRTSFEMASSTLQEKGMEAGNAARSLSSSLSESNFVQTARESASAAATSARGAVSSASTRAQGLASLTMSPRKLMQFIVVFAIGLLFVVMSFNFLPLLLLTPGKFSSLFTIGSLTILSSFAVLSGPMALLSSLLERSKLPFTVTYSVGLLGTLATTFFIRNYIATACFALVQAASLVYFVASFLPGGRSALNLLWRLGSRSARTFVQS